VRSGLGMHMEFAGFSQDFILFSKMAQPRFYESAVKDGKYYY
jgi:hypothetical protein